MSQPAIPSVSYKPSSNCTYSQLVNRIQGGNNQSSDQACDVSGGKTPDFYAQMTYEQQQYYQYYYTVQYYEYFKQLAQYQQAQGQSQVSDGKLDANAQAYIHQMAYAQYVTNHCNPTTNSNPYAQIVSAVNKESTNPYPVAPPLSEPTEKTEEPIGNQVVTKVAPPINQPSRDVKKGLLSLVMEYGSDSEEDEEEEAEEKIEVFKEPTGECQVVIDKMAVYVAKNGEQFEEIVKAKGDPRFDFLNETHLFYKYYKNKIRECKNGVEETKEKIPNTPKTKEKKIIGKKEILKKKQKQLID